MAIYRHGTIYREVGSFQSPTLRVVIFLPELASPMYVRPQLASTGGGLAGSPHGQLVAQTLRLIGLITLPRCLWVEALFPGHLESSPVQFLLGGGGSWEV